MGRRVASVEMAGSDLQTINIECQDTGHGWPHYRAVALPDGSSRPVVITVDIGWADDYHHQAEALRAIADDLDERYAGRDIQGDLDAKAASSDD